ncbi:aldehyde ferredoxin oxidoreductase family protein [Primorskyibacter aestuariivivens]|uniref:aldehyde ferredoxin oxidoreductase family protein n=1 Tax=Primorskyibacter aestuariivivens TaxID=1888912 RepID=UPI0022FFFD17|nr:aldehyde ferredoxin oxidoreductase family protein [Primorskyibacter aestuariivivens]MDA7429890.1 aldehyde ferredoxin oxidoreductase family protein [Primorskyibacter aestuariivivens]
MGWTGKILRIDLTNGTVNTEALNMEWADKYLGQRGLASKYLVEEVDPKADPLGPENKLIMATGPLTGTCASTGGRYSVITKGPLTGAIACSNSGGYFGAELKFAGWDMVIFEGQSPKPVYVTIFDDDVQIRDAGGLWGKSVWEADKKIKSDHQDQMIHVAAIGVAGENEVLYSCIVNDLHRAAGRSGVGAVMGNKNLKAVAVRGTGGVKVKDFKTFMDATNAGKKVLKDNAVTGQGLPAFGTQVLMNVINEAGAMPTRNGKDVQFESANDISAEAMAEPRRSDGKPNLLTNQACFGCTIACGRISKIDETHYTVQNKPEYWHASGGLEYEAAWALGSATGIKDLEGLTYVNFICNEQGLDPITFGATVGAAMELYETGVIDDKITGGIELKFGSSEALVKCVELTGKAEGFGKELGLGSKRLTEKYGKPELSMTVKGQEFPAYDPRGIQGMGLTYATSNRGACHLRGYTVASEILGIPEKTDPLETDGKPGLVKAFQDATAAVDSSGLCVFTTFAWTLEDIAPQVDAAVEGNWTVDKMLEVGERIWNMERIFNNKAGFTAADDNLPERLLKDAAKTGPAKGLVAGLDKMLPEYYDLRGWTQEGVPTNETLERLAV